MKANLLHLGLAATFALGITACQKDKDDTQTPATIAKISELKNGDEFVRFTYNSDGTANKLTMKSDLNTGMATVDYTIAYTADKKIASLTGTNSDKIEAVYENGRLSRADLFEGSTYTSFTSYTYENGRMTKATINYKSGATFKPFLEFRFSYDAQGNPSKTESFMAMGINGQLSSTGYVTMEYDNKTNPLNAHSDLMALFWQPAPKNNVTLEKHYDENGVLEETHTFAYTYKANGLPEKAVESIQQTGQATTTSTITYTY
ncbi:MAG: hypothetical protein JWP88_846 [Flaviaesturariibacter sp.]|nr:hypothetical protein [Flaviaesturariibacter sp.]